MPVVSLPAGQTIRVQPIFNFRAPHRVAIQFEDGNSRRWESDAPAGREYGDPWLVVARGRNPPVAVADVRIMHEENGSWYEGMWHVSGVARLTNPNGGTLYRLVVFYENLLGPFGGGGGAIGWRDLAVVFEWQD